VSVEQESAFSAGEKNMSNPSDLDQIVQDILADMPLKGKAIIANVDEGKV
jgi:hypothetical protein